MLTPEQKAKYVNNPNHCPYCGHKGISYSDSPDNIDGEHIVQEVECNSPECDKVWHEVYRVIDIEEENED